MRTYEIYDEENKILRRFNWKDEAVRFMQPGWTMKIVQIVKRDGYSEALRLGEALI
jgi:hypothetical protein